MEVFLEALHEAWHDTWLMIPLLYIAYCVVEYFERRPSKDDKMFYALQKYGPLFGALLGLFPQCGFSILAAMLFVQKNITLGTMVAVFIATSDEAIPILFAEPAMIPSLGVLLVLKFIIGASVGYLCDKVLFKNQKILRFEDIQEEEEDIEMSQDFEEDVDSAGCPCCYPQYSMWVSALLRTLKIYLFIFITTFVLTLCIEWIGIDRLSSILLKGVWFQPILAAVFGFIPNCAATVVLCQLFALGQLSFGSLLAGLITNAGLGILCLVQYGAGRKIY